MLKRFCASCWLSGSDQSINWPWYASHSMASPSIVEFADRRHQSFVYALFDICEHSEYLESLREEVESCGDERGDDLNGLSLLDSFLKESARLNTSDSGMTSPTDNGIWFSLRLRMMISLDEAKGFTALDIPGGHHRAAESLGLCSPASNHVGCESLPLAHGLQWRPISRTTK